MLLDSGSDDHVCTWSDSDVLGLRGVQGREMIVGETRSFPFNIQTVARAVANFNVGDFKQISCPMASWLKLVLSIVLDRVDTSFVHVSLSLS